MASTTGFVSTAHTLGASVDRYATLLHGMHGPTSCLAATVSQMVPIPSCIAALPDAHINQVSFKLSPRSGGGSRVSTRAHYTTRSSATEAAAFYQDLFSQQRVEVTTVVTPHDECVSLSTQLTDADETLLGVRIFASGSRTTVVVDTAAETCNSGATTKELGAWHGFELPDPATTLMHVEAFTLPAAHTTPATAVFTSRYHFQAMARHDLRLLIEAHLAARHWDFTERYEDILEPIAPFGAELCIDGQGSWSELSVLGEFTLG